MSFAIADVRLGVAVARCKKCGARLRWHRSVEEWQVHYLCDYCEVVFCVEQRRLFQCGAPLQHLLEPPRWVKEKYATPPRARDAARPEVKP